MWRLIAGRRRLGPYSDLAQLAVRWSFYCLTVTGAIRSSEKHDYGVAPTALPPPALSDQFAL
jgi:hypothetical protein